MSHIQAAPTNHCLTGCLYQVVQTTGLQGSNVLKLLPILKSKDNPVPAAPPPQTPSSALTLNVPQAVLSSPPPPVVPPPVPVLPPPPVLPPVKAPPPPVLPPVKAPPVPVLPPVPAPPVPPTPVSILSRPGPVSVPLVQTPTLGNYIIAARNNLTNTLRIENSFSLCPEGNLFLDNRQLTHPTNSVPGNPTILMMNRKPVSPVKPVTMLPPGHSIQIPAHAEVLSVPVSSLPFSIQQKILPQAGGTDVGRMPSVIYVTPVNTVKNSTQNPLLYSNPVTSAAKSPPQARPPTSEAPKGPMKWVVQQTKESAACLVPMKSSSDTATKILQMMSRAKMEEVNVNNLDRSKVVQIKENALVMCEDKIFFLTKKGAELTDAGSKAPPPYTPPSKPAAPSEPVKDLSSKAAEVVASKKQPPPPPPGTEKLVQSNVVSTAKPKRKSSTPRAVRDDPNVIYITDDDDCSQTSAGCRDVPCSPSNPTDISTVNAVNRNYQLKSEQAEMTTTKTDSCWRTKYGLLKTEKIILRRLPLIQAETPSSPTIDPSSAEAQEQQRKRKSSSRQTVKASKKPKSAEDGKLNPNSKNPEVSTDPPSTSSFPRSYAAPGEINPPGTTERSCSTWPPSYYGGGASYPPDLADFQADQDITGRFSDVSLPSQRFHIDSMYPDETTKDEKIQRLKEVLKEREKALEAVRRQNT